MRKIVGILAVVCVIGIGLVSIDADGGLFRRSCPPGGCNPGGGSKPPKIDVPIEELILDVPPEPNWLAPVPDSVQTVDIDAIVEAVIRQLPPVVIQIEHPNGTVSSQSKPLGEAIRFRLVPQ